MLQSPQLWSTLKYLSLESSLHQTVVFNADSATPSTFGTLGKFPLTLMHSMYTPLHSHQPSCMLYHILTVMITHSHIKLNCIARTRAGTPTTDGLLALDIWVIFPLCLILWMSKQQKKIGTPFWVVLLAAAYVTYRKIHHWLQGLTIMVPGCQS